jgi:IS5 family transposase
VAREEALFGVPLYCEFAGLGGLRRVPDRVRPPRCRHLLGKHDPARAILDTVNAHWAARGYRPREGTVVDATRIAAPSSTQNRRGRRDPQMRQTRKGNQWRFGGKAHIGVDAETGRVRRVAGTGAHDVTQAHALRHGGQTRVFADAGHPRAWIERIEASIRAQVEPPFRVIQRPSGHTQARYRGRAKHTAQRVTLGALGTLGLCRTRLAPAGAG